MARWEQQGSPGHSGLSLLVLSLGTGKCWCTSCCWSFPPRGTAGPGRGLCWGGPRWVEEPASGTHSQQLRAHSPISGRIAASCCAEPAHRATWLHGTWCVGTKSSGCDMVTLETCASVKTPSCLHALYGRTCVAD